MGGDGGWAGASQAAGAARLAWPMVDHGEGDGIEDGVNAVNHQAREPMTRGQRQCRDQKNIFHKIGAIGTKTIPHGLHGRDDHRIAAFHHGAVHGKICDTRKENRDEGNGHSPELAEPGWKCQLFFC